MAQQPPSPSPQAQTAPPVFIENHAIGETFADSLHTIGIGSGVITLTFTVTRTEDGKPPKLTRSPATRLVLTLPGAVELQQKLSAVLNMLQQSMTQAQGAAPVSAAGPKSTK